MPVISVILTSFNHGEFIREAIESVLAQTFGNFELIIWDDASVDDSWEIIKSYDDPRIRAFQNEENRGPVFGVNKAISEIASGKYIAIHHSDDIWEADKLDKQVAFLEANPDTGAVFSNALAIDERGAQLSDQNHFYHGIFAQPNRTRHEWLHFFFFKGNALCHPSVLIRKKCYDDCGTYLELLFQLPDFNMWIRLCMKYEIHVMPEKLIRFRVRDNELNTSGSRPEARMRGAYELYKTLYPYLGIADAVELFKIFPSMTRLDRGRDTDIDFVVAMACFEAPMFCARQLFGIDVLYNILADHARAKAIEERYGFGLKSFISLTGKYDFFSREEVYGLHQSIHSLSQSIDNLRLSLSAHAKQEESFVECERKLNEILQSKSWKLTKPLRYLRRVL